MWDHVIAGISVYTIWNYLWIFSFFGWVWECLYVSIKNKRLVNRGFVTGPVCTIYGVGAVSVFLLLQPIKGSNVAVFLGGVIVATTLEYVTASVMENIFHAKWWDYSCQKWNYKGRICLTSSIAWGFLSVLLYEVLEPFAAFILSLYSVEIGEILVILCTAVYSIDFTCSTIAAYGLRNRLEHMEEIFDEIYEYLKTTKLYETAGEVRSKVEELRKEYSYMYLQDVRNKRTFSEDWRELNEKMSEISKRFSGINKKKNFHHSRYISAYPHLKAMSQKIKKGG